MVEKTKQKCYNRRKKGDIVLFFEQEQLSLMLLDVMQIKQENVKCFNRNRSFCALSFRFHTNGILQTNTHKYRLQDNMIAFVPSGVEYVRQVSCDDMIVLHFYIEGHYFQNIECFIPKESERYGQLFKLLFCCWTEKKAGYLYECTAIVYQILALAHAECALSINYTSDKIAPSIAYLMGNYTKAELTIAEIASKSFVSEVYFRKIFRRRYGVSPKKYLINLRFERAKRLIEEGYYSLQEVASLSGFSDYKYFSSEFKKHSGVSPSQYHY